MVAFYFSVFDWNLVPSPLAVVELSLILAQIVTSEASVFVKCVSI